MNSKKKKALLVVVSCNILFLLIGILRIFQGHQKDITLYDIPLYDAEGIYDNESMDGRNLFTTDYPVSEYRFVGRTEPLLSGIYEVKVYYGTYQDDYSISCETGIDGNSYPVLYADACNLSALDDEFSYRIWVNDDIDYLDVCIECGKDASTGLYKNIFETGSLFYLDKIEVIRDYRATVIYKLLKLLALLMVLDSLFCAWWNWDTIREHFYVVFGLACIFLISSLCFMGEFNPSGHDMMFHYARIIGLADGLLHGEFPVKVQSAWLHGYGYAVSVCYGDILLYFPAVLYMLGVPIVHAYKTYVMCINLGTLLISYFCFQKISRSPYIGVTCTALYCLSVNRIVNIYLRMAVGEYSAIMFLPLILLGVYEIYETDPNLQGKKRKGWLYLCLGMTGVIQTHILSTVMVSIFLAFTVLFLIRKMSGSVFFSFVKSVLLALCLNLGFLIPFAEYSSDSLKVLSESESYGIQSQGLNICELFSVGMTTIGGTRSAAERVWAKLPESVGCSMLIMIVLTGVLLVKCESWQRHEKKQVLFIMLLSGLSLWMSTCYFPWNRLAGIELLKHNVQSIQFPWRFVSIAMPLLTYMACLVLRKLKEIIGTNRLYVLLAAICLISAFQGIHSIDFINRNVRSRVIYDGSFHLNLSGIASGGEYLLQGTDTHLIQTDRDVTGENAQAMILERKGLRMDVACQAQKNAWIEAPRFAYWHYRCSDVETKALYPITRGVNNKIHVDLPDDYQGTLRIDFVEPWYWRLAETVSLVSFLSLIVYAWRKYYVKR